ncbi:MAG: shikimate kinase [Aeromicrobium sp.]
MNIFLIGYRGSGKSSVARALAGALGWPWVDADEELERRARRLPSPPPQPVTFRFSSW